MKRMVEALTEETFDVAILGGGITGAGVALDAVLRGWRVALIDKGDFASGTSSVSSKLVHGGLRYLEQGEFALVYEALHERALLLRNAGHLVRPLRFLLPFYNGARVPGWKWRLGLTLYDLLAGRDNIHRSRPLERKSLQRRCPSLRSAGLVGGAEFFDAQMDDARLCIEVLCSAAERGARLANYVEATGFVQRNGRLEAVEAVDRMDGRPLTIRARQVLNATGPWVDHLCRLAGDDDGPNLKPTKGVHLVVRSLNLPGGLLLLHPADGRVFFVLPWFGKTLIGTTDTFPQGTPDAVTVDALDIAYLLAGFNHHFTTTLSEADVLGSFVGLRPLLQARPNEPSALSREFRVWRSRSGLLSVAGGKYTTYRHMAELITDELGRLLGRRQRCRTRHFRLFGAPDEPWTTAQPRLVVELTQRFRLPLSAATHLADRYGTRALAVARHVTTAPDGLAPIVAGEPDLQGEFAYQRAEEMALHPADHLLRRCRLGLFSPRPTR